MKILKIKIKPKKTLFKRNRTTIVLPKQREQKPLLFQHSKYFESEYEKEKKLLGWK